MKILLIEDEEELRNTVREYLTREKFIVECAEDYASAMEKVNDYDYDCVLLDIMLPGGSGLSILAHLKRTRKQESVIIISAKDSIEDKVEGLDLGADDYLAKPFHLAELNARVKSLLRRKKAGGDTSIVLGNLTLVPDTRKATVDGNELTARSSTCCIISSAIPTASSIAWHWQNPYGATTLTRRTALISFTPK